MLKKIRICVPQILGLATLTANISGIFISIFESQDSFELIRTCIFQNCPWKKIRPKKISYCLGQTLGHFFGHPVLGHFHLRVLVKLSQTRQENSFVMIISIYFFLLYMIGISDQSLYVPKDLLKGVDRGLDKFVEALVIYAENTDKSVVVIHFI